MAISHQTAHSILVDRRNLDGAVEQLLRDPYNDGETTRAQIRDALWSWLHYSIDRLIEDAATHVAGPRPFYPQRFENALDKARHDR